MSDNRSDSYVLSQVYDWNSDAIDLERAERALRQATCLTAGLILEFFHRSMTGTMMPFDIERAGRDQRQATFLTTGLILMFFHRSMTGTVMPFDLARAGRDLRQATCLITGL